MWLIVNDLMAKTMILETLIWGPVNGLFSLCRMERFLDERGYATLVDSETNTMMREHQLVALLQFEAREVFSDEKHIHHLLDPGSELGVKPNIHGNLVPVPKSVHLELHSSGQTGAPVDAVLRRKKANLASED